MESRPIPTFQPRLKVLDRRQALAIHTAALEILEYTEITGTEERKEVWDLLARHEAMERKHRGFVAEIKSLTKTPALQYIFEQILQDEKKHHAILETLMTKRFEKDPAAQWGILFSY